MGNKQILQQNNETLASILSNVLGLPSQESLKHGAYVWKKYDKPPTATVSFSWVSGGSTHCIKAECAEVDLTEVTGDFFVGLSGTYTINGSSYNYSFTDSNHITLNGSSNTFSYDQVTKQLTINTHLSSDPSYSDATKKLEQTFINFVVSDSPTAYPDGGEQGGYWYERVVERIKGEEIFFTQSTASRTVTIPHSLGVVPTGFHLRVTTFNEKTNGVKTVVYPFASDSSVRGVYKFSGNSSIQNGWFIATITNTEITIDTDSDSWTFAAGDEYRMIVWA